VKLERKITDDGEQFLLPASGRSRELHLGRSIDAIHVFT
jgi:hypothetical protein